MTESTDTMTELLELTRRALTCYERIATSLEKLAAPREACGNPHMAYNQVACQRERGHEGDHRHNGEHGLLQW